MKEKEAKLLNGLALAYMGDAIYDLYIREYLLDRGYTKPNQLHRLAKKYVSAKAQAYLVEKMLEEEVLSQEEKDYFKRGRNAKSHTKAKNVDVATYNASTGFEAVMGFLYLTKEKNRIEEVVSWCIDQIDEEK